MQTIWQDIDRRLDADIERNRLIITKADGSEIVTNLDGPITAVTNPTMIKLLKDKGCDPADYFALPYMAHQITMPLALRDAVAGAIEERASIVAERARQDNLPHAVALRKVYAILKQAECMEDADYPESLNLRREYQAAMTNWRETYPAEAMRMDALAYSAEAASSRLADNYSDLDGWLSQDEINQKNLARKAERDALLAKAADLIARSDALDAQGVK